MFGIFGQFLALKLQFWLEIVLFIVTFAPFKYYISIFPLALARPVFELQKCYLDENWSESNQEFSGVLRPGLACLVGKLR